MDSQERDSYQYEIAKLRGQRVELADDLVKVVAERDRYRRALEQIRDFPHAPDAWIIAAEALKDA